MILTGSDRAEVASPAPVAGRSSRLSLGDATGIDPHKLLHAPCVIDRTEVELAELQVRTGPRQLGELLAWAAPFECRTWAIESASGLGYLLAQLLVAWGEHVVDVPATLSSRVRLLGSGRSNKNGANDARAVAICSVAGTLDRPGSRQRPRVGAAPVGQSSAGRVLRQEPRVQPTARVGARVGAGRYPQGNRSDTSRSGLASIEPVSATQRQRLELAHETLDEIRALDAKVERSKARITTAVNASGTSLTDTFGVGLIIAALIIGYTGDITRFPTAGHFAAYNGTAPIEFSSLGHTAHRLSRRGNRTLNHAIHMIAVTQIRHAHSEGRGYYDRKIAEDHKPRRAKRALKRQISDRVFKQIRLDAAIK
jgi:transposase